MRKYGIKYASGVYYAGTSKLPSYNEAAAELFKTAAEAQAVIAEFRKQNGVKTVAFTIDEATGEQREVETTTIYVVNMKRIDLKIEHEKKEDALEIAEIYADELGLTIEEAWKRGELEGTTYEIETEAYKKKKAKDKIKHDKIAEGIAAKMSDYLGVKVEVVSDEEDAE